MTAWMLQRALRRFTATIVATAATVGMSPSQSPAATVPDFGPDAHWVSYGHVKFVPRAVIANDLVQLKALGATGIITYSLGVNGEQEAQLANVLGLQVILGIADPSPAANAQAGSIWSRWPDTVVAINVGNEGLCTGLYTWSELASSVSAFQSDTTAAITTSEVRSEYDAAISGNAADLGGCSGPVHPGLLSLGDFLSPNVYTFPMLAPPTVGCSNVGTPADDAAAAFAELQHIQANTTLPVFLHETGYPTDFLANTALGPTQGCTQLRQANYFCRLRELTTSFSHFNAFDDPDGDYIAKYSGLITEARVPKLAALQLSTC